MGDAAHPGPDRIARAVEQLMILAELLEQLPERVRCAFLMSRVDGLTYAQIADELGVSASMVKQYVARALAHCYIAAHGCLDWLVRPAPRRQPLIAPPLSRCGPCRPFSSAAPGDGREP